MNEAASFCNGACNKRSRNVTIREASPGNVYVMYTGVCVRDHLIAEFGTRNKFQTQFWIVMNGAASFYNGTCEKRSRKVCIWCIWMVSCLFVCEWTTALLTQGRMYRCLPPNETWKNQNVAVYKTEGSVVFAVEGSSIATTAAVLELLVCVQSY